MAIVHENETDTTALAGLSIAVVGYGNQGRSWALNLRDSGFAPTVCVRADETRAQAGDEGFETAEIQERLRALGCDVAQGFHWSEPVPANEVQDVLERVCVARSDGASRVPSAT